MVKQSGKADLLLNIDQNFCIFEFWCSLYQMN